jgi:hypothetical protein
MPGSARDCYMRLFFSVAGLILFAPDSYADAVDDAYRLCKAMERTGQVIECDVKGWGSTINVRIDTNSSEARKICLGSVETVNKQTRTLSGRWKLQIFSPYSGDRPIAICAF